MKGMGMIQRMFSRSMKHSEHPSFIGLPRPQPAQTEGQGVPNIVILNSLTHDQLLDLLKARHESCH
jgi:hypothetical protein